MRCYPSWFSIVSTRHPWCADPPTLAQRSAGARPGAGSALANGRGGGAVDQEAEQLRPAVVAARVHQMLALVDQREVEVGDDLALARADGLAQQGPVGRHDRGEAAAGDRAD